jgi:hypothetical protein
MRTKEQIIESMLPKMRILRKRADEELDLGWEPMKVLRCFVESTIQLMVAELVVDFTQGGEFQDALKEILGRK